MTDKELVERYRMALEIIIMLADGVATSIARKALQGEAR
jgi:hypothetical protein